MFITFEGVEGAGKTTQAKALVEWLNNSGTKAIFTREPGGTELAEKIRDLTLDGKGIDDPFTEFLLITAARHDHVERVIKPALRNGYVVVCDRFFDSSVVYQGVLKGMDIEMMHKIHRTIFSDFKPNMTFLLDIDPTITLLRKTEDEYNHYDRLELALHTRIKEGLLDRARAEPMRFKIIDSNNTQQAIALKINAAFLSAFS